MGFNLGLAAAAYQGGKAEQRRLRQDEYNQAQQDYEVARMAEQQSRRAQRDNAAGLEGERVTASRGLLGKQTQATEAQLDSDLTTIPLRAQANVGGLNAQISNQEHSERTREAREKTADINTATGLVNAQTAQDDANDTRLWGPVKRKENALKIEAAIAQMPIKRAEFQDGVLAGLYKLSTDGKADKGQVLANVNAIAESSLFPELNGKVAADIKLDAGNMRIVDTKGKVIAVIPVDRMKAAHAKSAEGKIMSVADGTNLYRIAPDGSGATALTNNTKTFNPNGRGGAGGGGGAVVDRWATALQEDAKAKGKTLSRADALRQANLEIKADPAKAAQKMLAPNFEYQMEQDPEKRQSMENEALGAVLRMSAGAKGAAPGLSTVSPKSQAIIDQFLAP